MTKFQEAMASAGAASVSRLLQIITPILLAALAWYFITSDTAKTDALDDLRAQLNTMSVSLARLEEQGTGGRQTQAQIDAEQNRRLDRLEGRFDVP